MAIYTQDMQPDAILAFNGPDSIKFLQGQTTCHLQHLSENNALYGAFCNPKGRIKTTFLLLKRSDESLLMLLSHDQSQYIQEQLKPYIAFFKSEITDVTEDYHIIGVIEDERQEAFTQFVVTQQGDRFEVQVPGNVVRKIQLIPASEAMDSSQLISTNAWFLADIRSGLVWTTQETREQFLPHDINLPGLGGVNYEKGCYTGQEIIARMHYRGNPKYSSAVLQTSATDVIFNSPLKAIDEQDTVKTIGHPISRAVSDGGNTSILVSVPKDIIEVGEIRLAIASETTILCNINKPFLG